MLNERPKIPPPSNLSNSICSLVSLYNSAVETRLKKSASAAPNYCPPLNALLRMGQFKIPAIFASLVLISLHAFTSQLAPSSGASESEETQLTDCFSGNKIQNLVYRYEGVVSENYRIIPGCEIEYGKGGDTGYPWMSWNRRETLKFFLIDESGIEHEITRNNGTLAVSLQDSKGNTVSNLTWDQICFPGRCYQQDRSAPWRVTGCHYHQKLKPEQFRLGPLKSNDVSIYCHPKNKSRIPVYSKAHPNGPTVSKVVDYEVDLTVDFKHGSTIEYQRFFVYENRDGLPRHFGCSQRLLLHSPGEVYRTYYLNQGAGSIRVVSVDEARKFGLLESSVDSNETLVGLENVCFASVCFPGENRPCQTGTDTKPSFNNLNIYYENPGQTLFSSIFDDYDL